MSVSLVTWFFGQTTTLFLDATTIRFTLPEQPVTPFSNHYVGREDLPRWLLIEPDE